MAGDASEDESPAVPSWAWWLLGLLALAAAIAIPLVVRSRRRRAWADGLAAATDEVAWFARVLLPQLQAVAAPAQVAGGWAVGADRVAAAEDRLTELAATAPGEPEQLRANELRDSVRGARARLDELVASGTSASAPATLATATADLEAVLAR